MTTVYLVYGSIAVVVFLSCLVHRNITYRAVLATSLTWPVWALPVLFLVIVEMVDRLDKGPSPK